MKCSNYNFITKIDNKNYIMCNLLYKSIIVYSSNGDNNKILFCLKNPNENKFPEINKLLINNKFLIEDNVVEEKIIIDFMKNKISNSEELNLTIFSTLSCNFECKYCYQNHLNSSLSENDIISIEKFIDKKINNKKTINLTWFGGEPLLALSKIQYLNSLIIKKYPDKVFNSSIVTNGYMLNEKTSNILINELNVNNFQITLDGDRNTHNKTRKLKNNSRINTFDLIFDNLINILKNFKEKVFIVLRINVYSKMKKENFDFLNRLLSYKNNIYISLNPIHNNPGKNPGLSEDKRIVIKKIIDLYSYIKKLGFTVNHWFYDNKYTSCQAGLKNSYYFLPKGKQIICTGLNFDENNIIGSLNPNGEIEKCGNEISKKVNLDDDCRKCKILPICLQGCDYIREIKNKKVCIPQKYFLNDYVKLLY